MELKQHLKLSQQLVMTPQLQQAIRLLQLSRLELQEEVRKELDGNPILTDDPEMEPRDKSAATDGSRQRLQDREDYQRSPAENHQGERAAKEVDWEKFLENRSQPSPQQKGGYEDLPPIDQNLSRAESLQEHLLWQLQLGEFSEEERAFGELVIGNLNDAGILDLCGVERPDGTRTPDLTIEDLADEAGLHRDDAPIVLEMLQNFDPIGVAARSLQECLLIQARAFGYDGVELKILEDHMGNLERRNFQAIAKDLKVPIEEVYEAAKEIQKLESRPARNFFSQDERSIGITPDVYVVKDGEQFVVADNDRGMQRLHINETLTQKLLKDPAAKEFVGEKLKNAQWLIRAIEQRRKTIIRVTECIVEKQREFFERGVDHLKPMILRDVAETVGMHESTISRVTTNKYVHTPQGLFELKYFFNSSIRRVADEDIASESVKQAIKKIVQDEDKKSPMSDQAIVSLLEKDSGIKIARRTVAKYREMLGILSSSRRKQHF
jgi:RNA polymerase sigma-54 factor